MRSYDRSSGSILNFFTRQILEILTDRSTKLATKLSAFTKSLHFQSIVVGVDFERQERQESFRAWAASKGMFTDSYSYWQRTADRASKGIFVFLFFGGTKLIKFKSRKKVFVLTTYDRYVDGQILKLGQTKPQNHESHETTKVCLKTFW